jgi:hypothetical protein
VQNYLECPAKFYYSSIKELEPENEVAESVDYGVFGNVFHETMRSLYTSPEAMKESFHFDWKGENEAGLKDKKRYITKEYIEEWLSKDDVIRRKIKSVIVHDLNLMEITGRNLVVTDVIVRYVLKTLQRDLELLKSCGRDSFQILGREMPVYGQFHGQKMKGFIDRIDSFVPGQARIVDYKTGKVLADDEDIHDGNAEDIAEKIFAQDVAERPKIALQFYIYDMLLSKCDLVRGRKIYNSVYSTAKLFKEAPMIVPMNERFYDAVSERLRILLDEMRDPDVPFRRTSDENVCSYCDFKNICGR